MLGSWGIKIFAPICNILFTYGTFPYYQIVFHSTGKGRYTLSVKLCDCTVWRHTRRKNWENCAVLTGNNAGLTAVLSGRLSRTELRSSLRESHSFLSLPADTTMPSSQGTPFLAIHSPDEHRMIYSFSNTTSYSTFYDFFSSFRITLWPMWLANSKRQPCFYPPQSHAQEDTQNWQKKLTNLMGNLCCAREHSFRVFRAVFFTQFNFECMRPLRWQFPRRWSDHDCGAVSTHLHLASRLIMSSAIPPLPLYALMACTGPDLFYFITVWVQTSFCSPWLDTFVSGTYHSGPSMSIKIMKRKDCGTDRLVERGSIS